MTADVAAIFNSVAIFTHVSAYEHSVSLFQQLFIQCQNTCWVKWNREDSNSEGGKQAFARNRCKQ